VYEQPIREPMQAKNTNPSEPTEMRVVQISDEGEPLMYKAEQSAGHIRSLESAVTAVGARARWAPS
jgi:hypothetical protein